MQETEETWIRFLGWEDPQEKKMASHFSILAWRIPWTGEPGGLQSIGLHRVRHDFNDSMHVYVYMYMYNYVYMYIYNIHTHTYIYI